MLSINYKSALLSFGVGGSCLPRSAKLLHRVCRAKGKEIVSRKPTKSSEALLD